MQQKKIGIQRKLIIESPTNNKILSRNICFVVDTWVQDSYQKLNWCFPSKVNTSEKEDFNWISLMWCLQMVFCAVDNLNYLTRYIGNICFKSEIYFVYYIYGLIKCARNQILDLTLEFNLFYFFIYSGQSLILQTLEKFILFYELYCVNK